MNAERAPEEVAHDLTGLQARLRGDAPPEAPDAVTVIEDDVTIRVAGIVERITRLEHDLARIDAKLDQVVPERPRVMEWRRLPEFNLCPPTFQLTLDDQIALLQGTIDERLKREG
jgi:uncharacterized small protein (DUF1192 family)